MSDQQPPRRARHLMDPDNPRPVVRRQPGMGIEGVQKWVMSALAVTTIWHMSAALVLFASYVDDSKRVPQVGLIVIATVFGVLGIVVGYAIHRKSPLTPWLAVGLVPLVVGLWLVFR